jgi:hypothetical protein
MSTGQGHVGAPAVADDEVSDDTASAIDDPVVVNQPETAL